MWIAFSRVLIGVHYFTDAVLGVGVDLVPLLEGLEVDAAHLETLLERAEEIKQPKRRESLLTFADQARLSKQLVTIDTDVPLDHDPADLKRSEADAAALTAVFAELESGQVRVTGMVGTPDGARVLRAQRAGPVADPEGLASRVAEELLAQGAGEIIAALR